LDVLQLTHSGRHSAPARVVAYHNPALDKKTGVAADAPLATDGELERIEDDFVEAARLAADAGFRAVDIKAAHGYLADELLGATTREGRYGGPLENRARFLRNVIGKIHAAVGKNLLLAVRLGCYDGVPYVPDPATRVGMPLEHPVPYPWVRRGPARPGARRTHRGQAVDRMAGGVGSRIAERLGGQSVRQSARQPAV
jgi:2,4-dienoyl-CoA reductase-like NADH-dependent reductase (Old Yellow Enzyme family)